MKLKHVALGWTLLLIVLLLFPGSELPEAEAPGVDKIVHLFSFYLFASLWIRAYPGHRRTVLLAGLLLAAGSEALQAVLPLNRSAEWLDFLADAVGLLLGFFWPHPLTCPVYRRLRKHRSPSTPESA